MEGLVWPIQLDILTWYAVGAQEQSSWALVHCLGALLSLISFVACVTCSCTTRGHPGFLSCKQGWCIRKTCYKYHVKDASLSLLWWFWTHHLVTHSILLNLEVFYDHRFICIMSCLCYSSIRCLHEECRYTTDATCIGVTLDYVVVSTHSLTQQLLFVCTFSNLPWCTGAPFLLYDLLLPSL